MDLRRHTERDSVLILTWEGYKKGAKPCKASPDFWVLATGPEEGLADWRFFFFFFLPNSLWAGLPGPVQPSPPLLPLFEQLANSSLHSLHLQEQDSFVLTGQGLHSYKWSEKLYRLKCPLLCPHLASS